MNEWRLYAALSRRDLESMLTSSSIPEAISKVSYRPLGAKLMNVVEKKFYDLRELFKVMDSFYIEEKLKLLVYAEGARIIDDLDNVFDLINAVAVARSLEQGREITPPLPFGKSALLTHVAKEIRRGVAGEFNALVKEVRARRITHIVELLGLAPRLSEEYTLDYGLKKIFGFLRDSVLIPICVSSETEPPQVPLLLSLSREDFMNICRVKNLAELPRLFNGLNPTYDKFSEVLVDVYRTQVSFESYFLALFIATQFFAQNLKLKHEHVAARDYLLMSSESVILRWILTCLESGLFIDESRNILSKWWSIA